MGFPYFSTFINDYLFSKKNLFEPVNLTNQKVIIDGYSFFYFIYDETRKKDQKKAMTQPATATQFEYNEFWEIFQNSLKKFQSECASEIVIFDGISNLKKHLRQNPERASSVVFNNGSSNIPLLLCDEFLSILHELKIEVHVSQGEADPMVVQMARKLDAYIVARDSDYHLYEINKGYVPLPQLTLSTLVGNSYAMTNVFQNMSQEGVALWAAAIGYDFINLDTLQNELSTVKAYDEDVFSCWLNGTNSDKEKRQRLTCQFRLLRYIQKVGETEAHKKVISLACQQETKFKEIMQSYIDISLDKSILTLNGNKIPYFLHEDYTRGKLDRAVIDFAITRDAVLLWQGTNDLHWKLILPICYILLKWDNSTPENVADSTTITFNKKTYDPFQFVQFQKLPSLENFDKLTRKERQDFVMSCINFAYRFEQSIEWNDVHRDYILWLSLLKLWFHSKDGCLILNEATLVAMIITFIKHAFLDTYDEAKERLPSCELQCDKLYISNSQQQLKSHFSRADCFRLRESIQKYAITLLQNKDIERELQECQQIYKELSIINQFFGQPYNMPPPRFCFSQLTYGLAVNIYMSKKKIWRNIENICDKHQLLFDIIKQLHTFIYS